jgi:molybdopterin converting factor small subunit
MTLRVQLFAQLRDLAGVSELTLDLPPGATVRDLLESLYEKKPALRARDQTLLVGAGVEFVDRDHPLQPGVEISIMPPVQGG